MKATRVWNVILGGALVLALTPVAAAQLSGTYTIDPSGSGTRNYKTFAAATSALSAGVSGAVIFNVASTTFKESVTVTPASGMSSTNTVTFVATGTPAVIDANSGQYGLTVSGACHHYVFNNLEVKNVANYALNVAGPYKNRASFLKFLNCKFDAPASSSSTVRAAYLNYPNDCEFRGCVFAGGGWSFYTQQINRCKFYACEFDGKSQASYLVAPFNSNDANNLWENCFFHDCSPTGRGLYFNWSAYGNNFFHNVILMNTSREAVFMGSCCAWSRAQAWRNNIIVNLGSGPCAIYGYNSSTFGGGPGLDYNDMDYNCYYHPNGTNTVQLEKNTQGFSYAGSLSGWQKYFQANLTKKGWLVPGGGKTYDNHSIEADPRLVSAKTPYDIHIQGSSPCLDAGTTTYVAGPWITGLPSTYRTATDFEGDARPSTNVDIGADEVAVRLIGSGSGKPGTTIVFSLFAPADAGLPYQMGSSFGNGPIPIGNRKIELSPDNLLFLSVQNLLPSVFQNYGGLLDAKGTATARLNIPNIPQLKGVRIYTAFVTIKGSAPFGISNISNSFLFTIQ